MYKKILGGIAIVAIAVVAAINFSVNTKNSGLSDISLVNIEALANDEEYIRDCYADIQETNNDKDKVRSCKAPAYSCGTFVSRHEATSSYLCH